MSCFQLTDERFNDLRRTLEYCDRMSQGGTCVPPYWIGRLVRTELNKMGHTIRDGWELGNPDFRSFVTRLRELNQLAFYERYPSEGEPKPLPPLPKTGGNRTSLTQLFKTIQCLSYQCSDYTGYDETPEGKLLKELEGLIAAVLLQETEEYKEAQWG